MYKKWILGILVLTFVVVLPPTSIFAADKPVSDCLNDDEDCIEDSNDLETDEEDTNKSSKTLLDDDTAEPSLGLNIVKMVFALLLILALIYTLLWFLKKRRSYEKAGSLENIGGISVGQQKSVQIIRIGDKMYLLGVGSNVELLKELSEEESENILQDMNQSTASPASSFVQDMLKRWNHKKSNETQATEQQFKTSFKQELDKLKEQRHQMIDDYNKKDDEHE